MTEKKAKEIPNKYMEEVGKAFEYQYDEKECPKEWN